ncbi:pantoate--beta-alanine ligase [Novosphingobium sp. SG720]|uniref:pantoate--beta-alanine ligase n=1 Tax=Novosphingobium sp. SG720 TaxID=2586998 RepID=UPI0014468793|nr:pantoate--beta-alanine ligase [Novosphingobium sp. SG720]
MQTIYRLEDLRAAVASSKIGEKTLALVPTMGALHEGHLTLVRRARDLADAVAVSIFVNPRQFGPGEDFDAYPRRLESDAALLAAEGVDILWAPSPEVMYPRGFATTVSVAGLDEPLCGAARPGHFDGVATVVCKLFNQVQPDFALFGEKDWQQLAIIRRMARDLDLAFPRADAIIGVPTVREADGLALSSRNQYLTAHERANAVALPRAIEAAIAALHAGADADAALEDLRTALLRGGFARVDYADLRDAETLDPLDALGDRPARVLVAAHLGKARLIDNWPAN